MLIHPGVSNVSVRLRPISSRQLQYNQPGMTLLYSIGAGKYRGEDHGAKFSSATPDHFLVSDKFEVQHLTCFTKEVAALQPLSTFLS